MMPWLTPDEIGDLCEPLTQHAAQIRYMRDELGLTVRTKPNGAPLVVRSHFEQVMNPTPEKTATPEPELILKPLRSRGKAASEARPKPNFAALREWSANRKRKPKQAG